jgi:hypothetical protein
MENDAYSLFGESLLLHLKHHDLLLGGVQLGREFLLLPDCGLGFSPGSVGIDPCL